MAILDPIRILLNLANVHSPEVLGRDDFQSWPIGLKQSFVTNGFLQKVGSSKSITCHECGEFPSVSVQFREVGITLQAIAYCPQCGPMKVQEEDLAQFSISISSLVSFVKNQLGFQSDPKELLSNRLWDLGRLDSTGPVILLTRGLQWLNAESTFLKLFVGKGMCISLGTEIERPGWMPGSFAFVSLYREITLNSNSLSIDRTRIQEQWEFFTGILKDRKIETLPHIQQTYAKFSQDKMKVASYLNHADSFETKTEKVKWAISITPKGWLDKDRASLVGLSKSQYSIELKTLGLQRKSILRNGA